MVAMTIRLQSRIARNKFGVLKCGEFVQGEGMIFGLDMSGEMRMRRRNEVFGCIPHGRGAQVAAGNR